MRNAITCSRSVHGRGAELDLLEHVGIGPERDRRARVPALRRPRPRGQLALRDAGLHRCRRAPCLGRVLLAVGVPVAVDFEARAATTARSRPTRPRRAGRPTPCSRRHRTCRPRAAWSSRPRPPTGPCTAGARRPGCRGRRRRRGTPPSARRVTSTRVQWPAIASSIALSTTSHTRWCSPDGRSSRCTCPAACERGRGPRAPGCARRSSRSTSGSWRWPRSRDYEKGATAADGEHSGEVTADGVDHGRRLGFAVDLDGDAYDRLHSPADLARPRLPHRAPGCESRPHGVMNRALLTP